MVSVSGRNRCRHCSAIHGLWAELEGVDSSEVERLRRGHLDAEGSVADAIALALCLVDECHDAEAVAARLLEHYSEEQIQQIEAVTAAIDFANRCGNTWDAFEDRLKGAPRSDSSVVDELAVLVALAPFGGPFLVVSKALRLIRGEPDLDCDRG